MHALKNKERHFTDIKNMTFETAINLPLGQAGHEVPENKDTVLNYKNML